MRLLSEQNIASLTDVRQASHEGITYYSVIDFLAVLRKTNYKTAQNYFHFVKRRLDQDQEPIPGLRLFRAQARDSKYYNTYFAPLRGIEFLCAYVERNMPIREKRVKVRKADEVRNLEPLVAALLVCNRWTVQHHLRLESGGIIDIVATHLDNPKRVMVIECKSRLNREYLFKAIGQVLCYRAEYDQQAEAAIASFESSIVPYSREWCKELGIRLIGISETLRRIKIDDLLE